MELKVIQNIEKFKLKMLNLVSRYDFMIDLNLMFKIDDDVDVECMPIWNKFYY